MNAQQTPFLRHQIDRKIVHALAYHYELGRSHMSAIVSQLQRNFSRITEQLELSQPLAFEFFANDRAPPR